MGVKALHGVLISETRQIKGQIQVVGGFVNLEEIEIKVFTPIMLCEVQFPFSFSLDVH